MGVKDAKAVYGTGYVEFRMLYYVSIGVESLNCYLLLDREGASERIKDDLTGGK